MRKEDLPAFAELLDAVWGLKGQPLTTAVQKAMFFRALAEYPIDEVRAGLDAHIRDPKRGQFLPMPADVIAQINGLVANDGRPGAEEAWAAAFRSSDDSQTLVWTEETAEALGIARPLLLGGDEVGARMAFKEAYSRLVARAREDRVPAKWSATLGHDRAERNRVLLPHVQAGRIDGALLLEARKGLDDILALPAPEGETEAGRAARLKARERLAEMRAERAKPRKGVDELERERTAALKAETAAKVASYLDAATNLGAAALNSEPQFSHTSTGT